MNMPYSMYKFKLSKEIYGEKGGFMRKRLFTMAITAALAATVMVGCGGAKDISETKNKTESSSEEKDESKKTSEDTKEEKKILNAQFGPSPETIDPALNSSVDGANMILHAFEGLLKFDEGNNVVNGLAEDYKVSEDGLTYTFTLRDGLKWSDGSELNAKDFEYSWKRVADPLTAAPYSNLLNVVEGFDEAQEGNLDALKAVALDDKTFEVTLNNPCTYFDKIVAFQVLVPVQQETIDTNGESWAIDPETYVTSGPYKMIEFTDGLQIVFEKNENYYNADKITFDEIVFHLIEEANAAYNAYNQDDIDIMKSVPTEEIPSLEGNTQFHVDPIMGTYYISFNNEKEPFNDPRVRKALSLVIDREYVANTLMQGTYTPALNYCGPGLTDAKKGTYFEEVTVEDYGNHFGKESYEEDVKKAQELLAEAGFPGGEGFPTFEYSTNDSGYHKQLAEYLQQTWKENLGINMNLAVLEWKVFTGNRRAGNYDVARNGWVCDWNDPSNMLELFETGNGNNDGKYSNPEFDKYIVEARETADVDLHYDLLHKAEQVALDDAAMAPVAYYNDFWLQKDNLKGTWHSPYGFWYCMYGYFE